jgi:hypothetical protein
MAISLAYNGHHIRLHTPEGPKRKFDSRVKQVENIHHCPDGRSDGRIFPHEPNMLAIAIIFIKQSMMINA